MYLASEECVCLNLFSGPGGLEVGMRAAGWRSSDFVEYDRHACNTLRANFPDGCVHECDIRALAVGAYGRRYYPVHLYTFPCERYSAYSNVWGAQTGDDLYLHCLRHSILLWPELVLIENVIGLRKFRVVCELWRNLPHYHTTELIVWGEDFTLQRKARVFLILHRQPFDFPALDHFPQRHDIPLPVLLARPGRRLGDYLDDPTIPGPPMRPYIEKRLNGNHPLLSDRAYRDRPQLYYPEQETPINLPTNYKRDRGVALVADGRYESGFRPFSVRELARLHGFPDAHRFCGPHGAQYQQVVDSVMPPVAYALGVLLNRYIEAIEELLPQPRSLGYRFLADARSRKMAPHDHLLHAPRNTAASPTPVEALPQDLVQRPLL
jgi:DNA (cytosine-5)-methyltransferase 1